MWEQTVERLRAAGLTYAELPQWYDVDEAADLERLRAELSQSEPTDAALRELSVLVNHLA